MEGGAVGVVVVAVAEVSVDDPVTANATDPIERVRASAAAGTTHLLLKNRFTGILLSLRTA